MSVKPLFLTVTRHHHSHYDGLGDFCFLFFVFGDFYCLLFIISFWVELGHKLN
jgi:hypothetical protein